ncbi:MAG: lipoprotein [Candidatus Omnitrophota bacterium]
MRRITYLLVAAVFLSGCATISSINKNYYRINYDDGVDTNEAKVIAKKTLNGSEYRNQYIIIFPYILDDARTAGYSEYRFVVFRPKKIQIIRTSFLVVVSKITGEVLHSGQFYTKGTRSFEPIFVGRN